MSPVNRLEHFKDSAARQWPCWLVRALIPVIVLFTSLFAETLTVRTADARDTAQATSPSPVPDAERRQDGVAPTRNGPAAVDYKQRRKQPSPPDESSGPSALLPPTAPAEDIDFATAEPGSPRPVPPAAGRYPPARPRAPPA